jgi:hypothetical protein
VSDTNVELKREHLEALLRQRLGGRVWELEIVLQGSGIVLRGQTVSYFAKQLAQHTVMEELRLPVLANEIQVQRKRVVEDGCPGG